MTHSTDLTMTEADIAINGVPLTFAQSMTLCVALGYFLMSMAEPGALGTDAHGLSMAKSYTERGREVSRLMHLTLP